MNNIIEQFMNLYNIDSKGCVSGLSDEDIIAIEDGTGYEFPEEYKSFLQNYNLPSQKVLVCFCGYSYAGSFTNTYSKEAGKYVEADDEEDIVLEFMWVNYDTSSKEKFIKSFEEHHKEIGGWVQAGYLYLGEFSGYQVFYDMNEENVYSIYAEDMYESEDFESPEANRECMEENGFLLCEDFKTFLEFVCTGKPYDEDDHVFPYDE